MLGKDNTVFCTQMQSPLFITPTSSFCSSNAVVVVWLMRVRKARRPGQCKAGMC